jgi:hypothetical protein
MRSESDESCKLHSIDLSMMGTWRQQQQQRRQQHSELGPSMAHGSDGTTGTTATNLCQKHLLLRMPVPAARAHVVVNNMTTKASMSTLHTTTLCQRNTFA